MKNDPQNTCFCHCSSAGIAHWNRCLRLNISQKYNVNKVPIALPLQYIQSKVFSKEVVFLLIFLEPVLCFAFHTMPDKAIIPQKIFVTLSRYVPYLSNVPRDISGLFTLTRAHIICVTFSSSVP